MINTKLSFIGIFEKSLKDKEELLQHVNFFKMKMSYYVNHLNMLNNLLNQTFKDAFYLVEDKYMKSFRTMLKLNLSAAPDYTFGRNYR